MKNVICPVSNDRIQSHIPRVIALYVVLLIITYAFTQWLPILLFLIYDFTVRTIGKSHISPLSHLAQFTSRTIGLKSELTNKAPKLFAARLGAIMFALAGILHLSGFSNFASIVSLLVGVLAGLEFAFNFCVGCYIYFAFVYPFYAKK